MPIQSSALLTTDYTQDDIEAAPDAVRDATIEQAKSDLLTPSILRSMELNASNNPGTRGGGAYVKRLQPDEAKQYMADAGLDGQFTFDREYTEPALKLMADRKRAELKRQSILARADQSGTAMAGRFGLTLATSFLDPLTVATAFVPVIGEAKYAAMLGKAGGALGRAGVRASVGAAEGAAGSILMEPIIYGAKWQEQADYTLADSLLNIAVGTVLGGGLHVVGGALRDAVKSARSADSTVPETRVVPDVADGTPGSIDPVFKSQQIAPITPEARAAVDATGALPSSDQLFIPQVPPKSVMAEFSRVEAVPLSAVRRTQSTMGGESPGALIEGYADKPVAARLESGEYLVYDGHHRAVDAIRRGEQSLDMYVVDAKRYAPESAGRPKIQPSPEDDDTLLRELGIDTPVAEVSKSDPATREAALRSTVAQAVTGQPIEARPIFDRSTLKEAGARLDDPDQRPLSDPVAVQRADATIKAGETADDATIERQIADLDEQIKAMEADAELNGNADMADIVATLRDELKQAESITREATGHAKMLATCATRSAA